MKNKDVVATIDTEGYRITFFRDHYTSCIMSTGEIIYSNNKWKVENDLLLWCKANEEDWSDKWTTAFDFHAAFRQCITRAVLGEQPYFKTEV